jgi:hypothetical protein
VSSLPKRSALTFEETSCVQGSQQISTLLSGKFMCTEGLNKLALYCWETLCVPVVSTIQHSTVGKPCVSQGSQQFSTLLLGNVTCAKGSQQISTLLLGNVTCAKGLNKSAFDCRETLCVPRVSTNQHSTVGKRVARRGDEKQSFTLRQFT